MAADPAPFAATARPVVLSASTSTNLKYQTIGQYVTQGGSGNPWLESFVKRDEIFWKWELWSNLALRATASASSEFTADGASARGMNDASVSGGPRKSDGEWVSDGELSGAWAQLSWTAPQQITTIVLHDRPDTSENVLSGTLTFSDGSGIGVGALPANGAGLRLQFPQKSVTWVRFTIDNAEGNATGLAEFEVYGPPTPK